MDWSYTERDPGLALFTTCLQAGAPMPMTAGMRVLEIGCCEADWLHLAAKAWPECAFVGVDVRAPNDREEHGRIERVQADVMNPDLFAPESFDAIVSLSAIEHVGLGHYGDPKDPKGDIRVMANAWRWLKPGGWLYFDVPYDPTGYRVQGTECRVYDDQAIAWRLSPLTGHGPHAWFSEARSAGTLVPKPTAPVEPFHYCAMVWRKS